DTLKIPYITLKKVLEEADSSNIIQCSRNALVNKQYVQNVDIANRIIQLKDDYGRVESGVMFKKYVKECFK
ncbi:MAG: LytTR family transcriptional regulator DNA-binding domain-containing protein, partial [Lachnospiraceae bacterium]|nr:LytTR family transcriptional regulator DNA-binding domain-containing protein [Lachnospiraceae bacterium]